MDAPRLAATAFVLLLVASATSVAGSTMSAPEPTSTAPVGAACAPPCGYINPLIDLTFPEKMPCGGGFAIRAGEAPDDCTTLMVDGGSFTLEGTVRWYWEMSEDGTYPDDPQTDIVLSFGGTASNPSYLDMEVDPPQYTITSSDLANPAFFKVEEGEDKVRVWYWFERPVNITFTRDGSPEGRDLDRLESRAGIASYFLKAKSTSSSDRFKEAFGVEEFRFLADPDGPDAPGTPTNDTPVPVGLALAGVAAVALLRRRQA